MSKRTLVIVTGVSAALALLGVFLVLAVGWGPLHDMIDDSARWLAGLVHR